MRNKNAPIAIVIVLVAIAVFFGPKLFSRENNVRSNSMDNQKPVFSLSSPAFPDGGFIPAAYSCDAANANPPLMVAGVPEGTQSLAIIMSDPDVPKEVRPEGFFDHWVVFNIDPTVESLNTGETFGVPGQNGRGQNNYTGPCPPTQYQPTTHRYFFTIYALDNLLPLSPGASKTEVMNAMQGHILSEAQLMGLYDRTKK